MFALTDTPIVEEAWLARCRDPRAGAIVTFAGAVRNHNEGKEVLSLAYEAYPELALSEGRRIVEEALRGHDILAAACVHRTGPCAIGDLAVFVCVSAAHRKEAFVAAQYIIDEVKHRLPVWKKEFYADGSTGWVNCACSTHGHGSHRAPS